MVTSVRQDNNDNLNASISCKLIPGSRTCKHKVGRIMSAPAQWCTRCRCAPGPGAWWQVQASLSDFAPICKPHIPSSRQHLVAVVVVVLMVVAVMVIGQVIDDGNKGETFIFSLQNKSSAFRKSATNCTVHNLICVCLTFCIGNCKKNCCIHQYLSMVPISVGSQHRTQVQVKCLV